MRFLPEGFRDSTYLAWERDYKEQAHLRWEAELGRSQFHTFLKAGARAFSEGLHTTFYTAERAPRRDSIDGALL